MESAFALVSFCNISLKSLSPLLCVKIPLENSTKLEFSPVNLGFPDLISSATGITKNDEKIFVVVSANAKSYIIVLDIFNLHPVFYQEVLEIKDPHSIVVLDDYLYIVSTGTDEVIKYKIFSDKLGEPSVVWKASTTGSDTQHINSIVAKENELIVSGFGKKDGGIFWSSALDGFIHNITTDTRLYDGIYHPHTLSYINGQLYYCESAKKTFCSIEKSLFYTDGYARGCDWLNEELVCVATSQGRNFSKSQGIILNLAYPGELIGKSGLIIKNVISGKTVIDIDLSWFGPEVYDVLLLDKSYELLDMSLTAFTEDRKYINNLKLTQDSQEKRISDFFITQNALEKCIDDYKLEQDSLEKRINDLVLTQDSLEKCIDDYKLAQDSLEKRISDYKLAQDSLEKRNNSLEKQINDIHNGLGWKFLVFTDKLRKLIFPDNSLRKKIFLRIFKSFNK